MDDGVFKLLVAIVVGLLVIGTVFYVYSGMTRDKSVEDLYLDLDSHSVTYCELSEDPVYVSAGLSDDLSSLCSDLKVVSDYLEKESSSLNVYHSEEYYALLDRAKDLQLCQSLVDDMLASCFGEVDEEACVLARENFAAGCEY